MCSTAVPPRSGTAGGRRRRRRRCRTPSPSTPRRHEPSRGSAICRVLASANGRVGSFEIGVSTDGTTWSVGRERHLAGHRHGEDGELHCGQRPLRPADRDHRGRQPRPVEQRRRDQPLGPSLGSWGPTINFPLVPAAAALLPGNRMLTWSAYSPTAFGGSRGYTPGVHPGPVHRRGEPGPGGQHRSRHVLPRDLDAAGREDPDQRRQQQLENHPLQPCDERLDSAGRT